MSSIGFISRDARADTPTSYALTASANTVSLEIDMAEVPLLAPQLLFASPSSAEAQLNSYGGSTAFASVPFFGQTIEGIGGLVDGLGSGVLPPIPQTLPGYVSSNNPAVPTDTASQGPYTVSASSGDTSSTAAAGIAASSEPALLSSAATATTDVESDGTLQSTAQSSTQPLSLGSLVQLGTIQASASMTLDPSGNLVQTSSFDLGTITLAGIKVGLTDQGLKLIGNTLAVPSLDALNAILASTGVSLALLPSTKTATSITSEGLQITLTKSLPIEGASALTIILGQATAQLQAGPSVTNDQTATGPAADIGGLTTSGDSGLSTSEPNESSSPSISTPSTEPTMAASSPGSLATVPRESSPLIEPTDAQLGARLGPDGVRLYLILLLVGLALLAASRVAGAFSIKVKPKSPR
jgi:hypothetical protein